MDSDTNKHDSGRQEGDGPAKDADTDADFRSLFASEAPATREPGAAVALARMRREMFDADVAPPRLGKLTVLERLGRGGMGVVYAAYDPDLDRRVAVKVLHLRSDKAAERALREGRALAQVTHPNVVVVHGVEKIGGRVHIVMEYVAGGTLRQWLTSARSWREIVRVFIATGRGLMAAHASGLVHGDFKPDNILIDETAERPRVADFGLAIAERTAGQPPSEPPDAGDETLSGGGTAGYAAPEQMRGDPIDGRADQFSFCVSLFEALYGDRPFSVAALHQGTIAEPPPADGVPTKVHRVLARGLRSDPAERYPSMDSLVHDLARTIRSTGIRRAGIVAGVVGIGAGALIANRLGTGDACTNEPRELAEHWASHRASVRDAMQATAHPMAEQVATRIDAVAEAYVAEWSEAWSPTCAVPDAVQTDAALHRHCLTQQRQHFEALIEAMREVSADELQHAANALTGMEAPQRCLSGEPLRLPTPAPEHTAEVGRQRVALARARADTDLARYADADASAASIADVARTLGDDVLLAEAMLEVARAREHLEPAPDAAARYEDALWHAYRVGHHALVARAANGVIRLREYEDIERGEGALWLTIAEHAVAVADPGGAIDAETKMTRARLLLRSARIDDSLAVAHQALTIATAVHGERHPAVADCRVMVGEILASQGHLADAVRWIEEAANIYAETLFGGHPRRREAQIRKANALRMQGHSDEAIALLRELITHEESARGTELLWIAQAYGLLAETLRGRSFYTEAEAPARRALEIRRAAGVPETLDVAIDEQTLAMILGGVGNAAEAETHFREAMRIERLVLGEGHPRLAMSMVNLASFLQFHGGGEDVVSLLSEALAIVDRGELAPIDRFNLRGVAGRVFQDRGLPQRARRVTEKALADLGDAEVSPERRASNFRTLARATLDLKDYEATDRALTSAWALLESIKGERRLKDDLNEIKARLDAVRGTAQ